MKQLRTTALCTLLLASAGALAQDRADIDKTQIIGNRELPKVLYIVPWKKPLPGELSGRPVHSVLDEALAPVDREVFRRQVGYSAQIQARQTATQAAGAAGSGAPVAATPAPTPIPTQPTAP